jgi:alpha-1,2-mannosyltransferase
MPMSAIPHKTSRDLISPLRDAQWLDGKRARGYARVMATVLFALTIGWIFMARGGVDMMGKALGTDFASFYTAATLALSGNAAGVYDLMTHGTAQMALFGQDIGYAAFFYPPIFILFCLPFGLFPYLVSLALWQASTLLFYWRVARQFGGGKLGALPLFAFPAVVLNIGHGQNAFLSTGLFGAGILWLNTRPVLAGVMFGCLAYKPHLGLVIPLVLAIGGRWLTIASAGVTVTGLCAASALIFGIDTWKGFLAIASTATAALEQNTIGPAKMQSAYAAVRVLGGGSNLAYLVQGITAACVLGVLLYVQIMRQRLAAGSKLYETPLMVLACLLTSPFLLDYDLMLMALPMAWVFAQAMRTGFLPYEKIVLFAAFILPLVARALAQSAGLPIGPLVITALFAVVARRALIQPGCDIRAA